MIAGKQQLQQSQLFSLKGSILTLSIVTLLSFTCFSFKSLRPTLPLSPPTPQLTLLPSATSTIPYARKVADREENNFDKGKDDDNDELFTDIYHSPKLFKLNFEEMERKFKVYIYPDGDPKTFYQTPRKLTGKYASEGYFFQNIRESRFRTDDPDQAHLFFIPISCHKMRGKGTSYENMTIIVQNYLDSLIGKYPYWNRTLGADHFFVTCHDVGVRATEGVPFLVKNAIRVVCSPSYDVGFIPHKDVALPQVLQPFALPAGGNDVENRKVAGDMLGLENIVEMQPLVGGEDFAFFSEAIPGLFFFLGMKNETQGQFHSGHSPYYRVNEDILPYGAALHASLATRTRLGFWAGHRNSKIRVILARVWENDTELDISNNRISRATGHLVYQKRFYRTKFCICPGGSQVNSARIADSIHYGCVPVILSNYYDLPFNDILDWQKFAVVLKESDVYQLKQILKNISDEEFFSLHKNLVKVQKHFQWNSPPIKYDAFHMVMYELWLRHHVIKY